jgi:hypothetical protein
MKTTCCWVFSVIGYCREPTTFFYQQRNQECPCYYTLGKQQTTITYLPRGGKPLTAVEEGGLLIFLEDSVLELETESVSFTILLPAAILWHTVFRYFLSHKLKANVWEHKRLLVYGLVIRYITGQECQIY